MVRSDAATDRRRPHNMVWQWIGPPGTGCRWKNEKVNIFMLLYRAFVSIAKMRGKTRVYYRLQLIKFHRVNQPVTCQSFTSFPSLFSHYVRRGLKRYTKTHSRVWRGKVEGAGLDTAPWQASLVACQTATRVHGG